jgi:hypothetical protein
LSIVAGSVTLVTGTAGGFLGIENSSDPPAFGGLQEIEGIDAAVRELAVAEELVFAPNVGNCSVDGYGGGFGKALDEGALESGEARRPLISGCSVGCAGAPHAVEARVGSHGGEDLGGIVGRHSVEDLLAGGKNILLVGCLGGERKQGDDASDQQTHGVMIHPWPKASQASGDSSSIHRRRSGVRR